MLTPFLVIPWMALLLHVLVLMAIVAVGYLIAVLSQVYRILGRIDRIAGYADHVRSILQGWEELPMTILKRLLDRFFPEE